MGMDQSVTFDSAPPSWDAVSELLARRGYPVQVRMIDGELAFPDERPPESWRELRLGTPGGMVTVRREGSALVFVTWGNAGPELLQAWNALAWAFAAAGGGRVVTAAGTVGADDFFRAAELPEGLVMKHSEGT